MNSRFPFTSFPTGWFCVAHSHELRPEQVKPLRYFGKDLVLFRTKEGVAHVFDAHCPHLGAHLGYGGKVKGETIQCPFHGWCFDGSGQCSDIPYASKIPPKAQMRTWPVREVNGLIIVYHHAQGEPPTWEVPEFPECNSREWVPFYRYGTAWKIRTHLQELGEQVVDFRHIPLVHDPNTCSAKTETLYVEGAIRRELITVKALKDWDAKFNPEKTPFERQVEVTYYGLGIQGQRFYITSKDRPDLFLLVSMTPVDEECVEVRQSVSLKRSFNLAITSFLAWQIDRMLAKIIEQDFPILENKLYRSSPLLCEGDGQIMQYRHWASQFYPEMPARAKIPVQERL